MINDIIGPHILNILKVCSMVKSILLYSTNIHFGPFGKNVQLRLESLLYRENIVG